MTLIHLYRKYKRWNPVHPTLGAFWGFGLGLGCGVGWGPGFGPEVVGFVGSGCGVGVSIGVTLIGVGVGLPASDFACLPCDAAVFAGGKAVQFAGGTVAPALGHVARNGWQHAALGACAVGGAVKKWGGEMRKQRAVRRRQQLQQQEEKQHQGFNLLLASPPASSLGMVDYWRAAASTIVAANRMEQAVMPLF